MNIITRITLLFKIYIQLVNWFHLYLFIFKLVSDWKVNFVKVYTSTQLSNYSLFTDIIMNVKKEIKKPLDLNTLIKTYFHHFCMSTQILNLVFSLTFELCFLYECIILTFLYCGRHMV